MALKKKTKKKTLIKSNALEKLINSAVGGMEAALESGTEAINVLGKEVKSLNTQGSRLRKKRVILLKRKKATTGKLKKSPNAELRKLLRDVERELASSRKELTKVTSAKDVAAGELGALKGNFKKVSVYAKAIEKADKVLNKPVKKKKRKKSSKVALAA